MFRQRLSRTAVCPLYSVHHVKFGSKGLEKIQLKIKRPAYLASVQAERSLFMKFCGFADSLGLDVRKLLSFHLWADLSKLCQPIRERDIGLSKCQWPPGLQRA